MADFLILKIRLQQERHVVNARQRARDIAALLGFDKQDQVRVATATSELTRNAFRYAREGVVEFSISDAVPQFLNISVRDAGSGIPHLDDVLSGRYISKTGMGKGLTGTQRLMDVFHIESSSAGTHAKVGKVLPTSTRPVTEASAKIVATALAKVDIDPFQEVERQNQELLDTLAELNDKQLALAQVNNELEDTNRGVVALYAELEQNASELRRISDQKTNFLSNLSHEFRTPLNAILALCQILTSRSDGDLTGEQQKQVDYIRKSAADLSELVNDLLDVAKVEAGRVDVKPTLFSVADVFAALRGMLRTLLTNPSVQLVFDDASALPELFTDEQKVSQILRNLIANALKFTERGQITVTAHTQGDVVLFQVADTGIGVAPADQERIFEEFVQVSGEIQSRVRGTGLGLPLSRKLAGLLGGTLQVTSSLGTGSVFSLALPIHFKDVEIPPTPTSSPQQSGPRVILIEDNAETRFIHQVALKNTPYCATFCRNIDEARVLLQSEEPQAIVLDRMLDGEDALSFLKEIRAGGYAGKVIVVSVMDEPQTALQAGADLFLSKPIAHGRLAGALASLLGHASAKSLLLVDDDEINRYILREALLPYHFNILEARTGREAVEIAAQQPLDGIFLDMSMPGLTGSETLRELRNSSQLRDIPVIIHTSKDLTEEERDALEGFHPDYLPKKLLGEAHAQKALQEVLLKVGLL